MGFCSTNWRNCSHFSKNGCLSSYSYGYFGGLIMALLFQGELMTILGNGEFPWYETALRSVYGEIAIPSENAILSDLLSSSGMYGMMGTVWLVLSAMAFGGAMEACGFLTTITKRNCGFGKKYGIINYEYFNSLWCIKCNCIRSISCDCSSR